MHGYTVNDFHLLTPTFLSAVPSDTQQVRSHLLLSFTPTLLHEQGLLDDPPPPL